MLSIDSNAFELLLNDGISANANGDPNRAVLLLNEAESLWRGPAYAEFADREWLQPEVERLQELRKVASDERVAARLALGSHAEVVADLERVLREEPLVPGPVNT